MFSMPSNEIGGGIVRRTFNSGGKYLVSGTRLSGDAIRAMPAVNRNALIEKKYLDVFPIGDGSVNPAAERFVVSAGFGRFYVVEGRKINADPLDKEQANALAGMKPAAKAKAKAKK